MKIKITRFFTVIFLLISNVGLSQDLTIRGEIKSAKNEILQYVNIGIKDKNIGTISDENGKFTFKINKINKNDTLTISYLGYKEFNMKIADIIEKDIKEFTLTEQPFLLNEVVIASTKGKEKKLGTTSTSSMVAGTVRAVNDLNNDIQEFAKELKIKKPSRVLNLNINLFNVNVDSTTFRINFYNIKDDLPNEKIQNQRIIITQDIIDGWNQFDLSEYNLVFVEPVFITLEYLPKNKIEKEPFRYSGQLFGKSIKRSSSLGKWNVTKGAKIALYVVVKQ